MLEEFCGFCTRTAKESEVIESVTIIAFTLESAPIVLAAFVTRASPLRLFAGDHQFDSQCSLNGAKTPLQPPFEIAGHPGSSLEGASVQWARTSDEPMNVRRNWT